MWFRKRRRRIRSQKGIEGVAFTSNQDKVLVASATTQLIANIDNAHETGRSRDFSNMSAFITALVLQHLFSCSRRTEIHVAIVARLLDLSSFTSDSPSRREAIPCGLTVAYTSSPHLHPSIQQGARPNLSSRACSAAPIICIALPSYMWCWLVQAGAE